MAGEEALKRNARVNAVHLKLGRLSGVVKDALMFSYEVASEGTSVEGSRLIIDEVPIVVFCPACAANRELDEYRLWCPVCNGPAPNVLQGKELEVVALEVA